MVFSAFRRRPRLNLALQGGGAHGAFTWGVLDRLLEEDAVDIGWISATSAGAVNAVALAAGLAAAAAHTPSTSGTAPVREALRNMWEAVHKAGVPDLMRLNPFLFGFTRAASMSPMASLFSPYEFNPLGFDPLRKLLEQQVDFAAIRGTPGPELLIAATDLATGRARLFRRAEMTVEAVLASACLPMLHHTVTIEGRAYWDGGFTANPDLITLAMESPVRDTLIVQLNPNEMNEFPTSARAIAGHVSRLTFQQPLLRDVQMIVTARAAGRRLFRRSRGAFAPLTRHRFHLIEAGRHVAGLGPETKMKPDWGLLTYLHGAGRTEAHKWLERHGRDIGRRETADLEQRFLRSASRLPMSATAADEIAAAE